MAPSRAAAWSSSTGSTPTGSWPSPGSSPSFMAGLAGVLLAPIYGAFNSERLRHLDGRGHRRRGLGAAAVDAHRRGRGRAHRGGRRPCCRATSRRTASGTRPSCPSLPFLRHRRCAAHPARDAHPRRQSRPARHRSTPRRPRSPPPPRAPSMDRIIRVLWWVLFAAFCVSMLTWMPDDLGDRLQRRPGLLDRPPLHHADHRHGGPALAVPGHPGRASAPSPRPSWPTISGSTCSSAGLIGAAAGGGGRRRAGAPLAAPARAWASPS